MAERLAQMSVPWGIALGVLIGLWMGVFLMWPIRRRKVSIPNICFDAIARLQDRVVQLEASEIRAAGLQQQFQSSQAGALVAQRADIETLRSIVTRLVSEVDRHKDRFGSVEEMVGIHTNAPPEASVPYIIPVRRDQDGKVSPCCATAGGHRTFSTHAAAMEHIKLAHCHDADHSIIGFVNANDLKGCKSPKDWIAIIPVQAGGLSIGVHGNVPADSFIK